MAESERTRPEDRSRGPLRRLLGSAAFDGVLCVLGILVFTWPLVSIADTNRGLDLFLYLFGSWSVLIALSFLHARLADSKADRE